MGVRGEPRLDSVINGSPDSFLGTPRSAPEKRVSEMTGEIGTRRFKFLFFFSKFTVISSNVELLNATSFRTQLTCKELNEEK